MHTIDYLIFAAYMLGILGIGFYHFFRNKDREDYYVGGRNVKPVYVGLSVVATDVGGGFSIGLGGVGFVMGLAGSWLLFTGLVGAWLCAVFIIPKIKRLDGINNFMTYPDFLRFRYGATVATLAAVVSGIGYLGFAASQMLAGATLATATILPTSPIEGMEPITFSLIIIALVTVVYTVFGGIKAVIYTDAVQWSILLIGLVVITIPAALYEVGGFSGLRASLPDEYFSLTNITGVQFINWMVTIVPIWLIGMTLYQRLYACKDEADAKKAWYIAGLFEYPIMAFTGVFLGMCAKSVFPGAEAEQGLPMLIAEVLPVGVVGIVISAYFSAIMSTSDSCLMAASGNFLNDVLERYWLTSEDAKNSLRYSMLVTLIIGVLSVIIAAQFNTVLEGMLYAYGFMVSGLFVPTFGAYFFKKGSSAGAIAGMLGGGMVNLILQAQIIKLPPSIDAWGFDPCVYGILASFILYKEFSILMPDSDEDDEVAPEKVPG